MIAIGWEKTTNRLHGREGEGHSLAIEIPLRFISHQRYLNCNHHWVLQTHNIIPQGIS